ncbi:MAG: hypothetical protein ACFFCO_11690 [Promethearchaeota archaeon]
MAQSKFAKDLSRLLTRLEPLTNPTVMRELKKLRKILVRLHKRRLVKINHSVIELLCARHLLEQDYQVAVEHVLSSGNLIADIFAVKLQLPNPPSATELDVEGGLEGDTIVVEIETGFVPPDAALLPEQYRQARISAKIARYSGHARRFILATPSSHVLQVPQVLLRPPPARAPKEIRQLKKQCDYYYSSPPISFEALASVEIDVIYIVQVDRGIVIEIPPHRYLDTIMRARGILEA